LPTLEGGKVQHTEKYAICVAFPPDHYTTGAVVLPFFENMKNFEVDI
jgi:hypothetical protein